MSAGSSATVQAEVIAAPQPILAPESNNPRAFVSHSSQDHEFVEKFSAELRQHGVDAWYAGWEIKPGDSIRAKIDEGLEGCEFFIIVLSKNSINRPWVQKELDAATMRNISGRVQKIIPIKIENCGNLPPTLGSLCWEDFSIKPYELAIERILHSILGIDGMPPLGSQPTASTSRFQRSQMSGLIADLPQTSKPMSQEVDAELWSSITVHNIGEFADVLRNEGFAAKGSMFIGQCGLDVGPKGLDPNRMPKPGSDGKTISALFFPLWELNHRPNRRLVNARKFHDIEESRPPDWLFNRPYHEIILVGSERLKQRAAYNGFILSVSYNGRVFAQEVRDPLRPELFSTADIYPTIESARIGAIRATQHMGTADGRETTHGDVDWVDVVE